MNINSSTRWRKFLQSLKKREVAALPLGKRFTMQPEALEGRIAPAAFSFSGPGASKVDTDPSTKTSFTVVSAETIADLNLTVNIGTPYADNIDIFLSHGGVTVQIYDGAGDSSSSFIDATFDDEAASLPPTNGTVSGTFKSNPGLLSAFDGLPLDGLWSLITHDTVVQNDSTPLISWSISGDTGSAVMSETEVALSGGNLLITDANGGTSNDTITFSRVGGNIRINDPGHTLTAGFGATQVNANTVDVLFETITAGLTFNGLGGNDVLTVDFTGGNPIPASGIVYNGGAAGNDSMVITGGTTGTVTHSFTNANDGSVTLAGALAGTITYTGLEPITDNLAATDRVFDFTGGTESISLVDATGATMTIDSSLAESVTFANPTNSITINAGSGDDTITITSMDSGFTGALSIFGDAANDSLTLTSLSSLSALTTNTETLATLPAMTIGAGGLNLTTTTSGITFGGAVTVTGGGSITANAGSTISLPSAASDLATSGTGAISLTTTRDILTGSGSSISTADGNITLSANVAGSGVGFGSGINLTGAAITSSGTGGIVVTGRGGSGANFIEGVALSGSVISVVDGNLQITGTGGTATGLYDSGVRNSDSVISSTGSGNIQIVGTAGTGTTEHYGISMGGAASSVTSSGTGTITLQGTASAATIASGVQLGTFGAVAVTSSGSGAVNLVGDSITIDTTNATVNGGANTVTLRQLTNGTLINLGAADSAGTLGLTDAELDLITAGTLQIGNSNSGAITVSAAISHANNLSLTTGAGVTFDNAVTMAVNKNFTVSALGTSNGTISLPNATSDLTASGTGAISLTTTRDILTGSGSSISTADGNITLSANVAGSGVGFGSGINLTGAAITSSGTGGIVVTGRGGSGANFIEGVALSGSVISVVDGNLQITGTGGTATGLYDSGVRNSDSVISSTGSGNIQIVGTAGTGTTEHYGISMGGAASSVTSSGTGTITLQGTASAATIASGVQLGTFGAVAVTSSGSGAVNLVGDSITIDTTNATVNGGANTVTLRQLTNGTLINLGAADSAGTLGLTDAELDLITAGTLQIGNSNSGAITVSAAISHANNLSLTTGAGVTFDNAVTMAVNKNFTVSALGTSNGTISLPNATSDLTASGTGAISLTTTRDIQMGSGSSLSTVDGNLTLSANAAGTTSGNFVGVNIAGGLVQATGTGVVSVTGRGGNTGAGNWGVGVYLGGDIIGGTTGTTLISGTGGAASGDGNVGIRVNGAGSSITSNGSAVSLTGVGGGSGASAINLGIGIDESALVSAGGTGAVTVHGTGGGTAASGNYGLVPRTGGTITSGGGNVSVTGIAGSGNATAQTGGIYLDTATITAGGSGSVTVVGTASAATVNVNVGVDVRFSATITSAGGDVSVTATGGISSIGTFGAGSGVRVIANGLISAGGTGNLTVTGTGGAGANDQHQGVVVNGYSLEANLARIGAGNGTTTVTAISGNTLSHALEVGANNTGRILPGGNNAIIINADSIAVGASGTINSGTSTTTINTRTAGTLINLGGADVLTGSPLTLGLTDAELDLITAGTLQIGNASSGAVTVSAAISHTNTNAITLTAGTGLNINLNANFTTAGGPLTFSNAVVLGASVSLDTTNAGGVPAGAAISVAGNINLNANTLTHNAGAANTSITTVISGTNGALTKLGTGTLTLSGANTYTGATTVSAGVLTFSNRTISSTAASIASGATLEYAISSGMITQAGITFTGTGTLLKTGSSRINFGSAGTVNWELGAGALIDVQGGELRGGYFSQDVWTSNLSDLNIASGATFIGTEANVRIDKLTGSGTLTTGYNGAGYVSFTAGVNGGSSTFSGPISVDEGVGNFTKVGTGTLTLSGASNYVGATTINAGTLLVNGSLASGSAVTVASGGTLGGTGSVNGSVAVSSGGTLAPGVSPGILNTGSVTFTSGSTFTAEVNGATAGSLYDQLNVTGTVTLGNATLNTSGTTAGGGPIILINNDGADAVSGTFNGLSQGATVAINGQNYTISYTGGTGNDVVLLSGPETDVSLSGGNLVVTDINGGTTNDTLTISINGTNVRVNDPNNLLGAGAGATQVDDYTVDVPLASITGNIQFNTLAGDDTVTVNFSGGNFSDAISFTGTATDVVFNLPAGPNTVTFSDDGTVGNGLSRLSGATFELTNFANPSGSLTINRGDETDTLTVNALPDFDAGLTIGSGANPFGAVTFAGAITLAAHRSLSADVIGTISFANSSADIATSGTGSVTLTTARDIVISSGASIVIANGAIALSANQQTTATTGNFIGIDINASVVRATGAGAITLMGRGGDGAGGNQIGVRVSNGGDILGGFGEVAGNGMIGVGGSPGGVSVGGIGGASAGAGNFGVSVSDAGSSITSNGADVFVAGLGGGAGSSASNIGVFVINGGVITAGSNGAVIVEGTGGMTTGNGNVGVAISAVSVAGSMITSSGGNVSVMGTGGGAGSATHGNGVIVADDGVLTAGGSGSVTVVGHGSANYGSDNFGVNVQTASITSDGGNVSVTGYSGRTFVGGATVGVYLADGSVSAGGTGTVTVVGTGEMDDEDTGAPSVAYVNLGVDVRFTSSISSSGGNVQVTGTAGNASSLVLGEGSGVRVFGDGLITAGGSGTVTVTGDGGDGTGPSAQGVFISGQGFNSNLARIGAANGATTITAYKGFFSQGFALVVGTDGEGRITTGNNNAITINADSASIGASATISSGTGTTAFYTTTTGFEIELGSEDVLSQGTQFGQSGGNLATSHAESLGLSSEELDRITAGTLQIGNAFTGGITVSQALSFASHLSITTSDKVTLDAALTMAADKNLTISAVKAIELTNSASDLATTGVGAISLMTARNITMFSGASITTVDGNISLSANQQLTPTGGNFTGFFSNGGLIQVTGTGDISILAKGGDDTGGAQNGVQISFGGMVVGGNESTVTVQGTGGILGGEDTSVGVVVDGEGSSITSAGADVNITGLGVYGVMVTSDGTITSGGTGGVFVNGAGGAGTNAVGVYVGQNATITSGGGGINVTGAGGSSGSATDNYGVILYNGGNITSPGSSDITILASTNASNSTAFVTTLGTNRVGFNGSNTYSGNIVIHADSMSIAEAVIRTTNIVGLRPVLNGTSVNLGGADSAGTLGLTDVELDQITAATTQIGDANTGAITITAPISSAKDLALFTTGVTFSPGGGLSYLLDGSASTPVFGAVGVFGSQASVDLTNGTLALTNSLSGVPKAPLTILDVPGVAPVTGTFAGLAEGALIVMGKIHFNITYVGGDGNDVQLLAIAAPPGGTVKLADLDGTKGFTIYGEADGDRTGQSVSGAGDINGDSIDDFIIGANGGAGRAYVVFGNFSGFPSNFSLASLDGTNGFRIDDTTNSASLGLTVSKAGDVNGDGRADLLVSEAQADGLGATFVVFGKATPFAATLDVRTLDGTNGFKLFGSTTNDQGTHVASGAGDVNGDGAGDIIIGISTAANDLGSPTGAAYVVFGHLTGIPFTASVDLSGLNGTNGFKLNGETAGGFFGGSVSSAGDVNGDGKGDLIIGAYGNVRLGVSGGAAYVFFGKAAPFAASINASTLNGPTGFRVYGFDESRLGYSVSGAGDINGDTFGDIVIGSSSQSEGEKGAAYVIFGKGTAFSSIISLASLNGDNGFAIIGEFADDLAGESVSGVGDFNGDGYDDILVGQQGVGAGTSYLIFGRPNAFAPTLSLASLRGTTGFKYVGVRDFDASSSSLSGAGDVNGDGKMDLIIGAFNGGPALTNPGAAYVIYGTGAFHAIPVITPNGGSATYEDVDGDTISVTVNVGELTADIFVFNEDGELETADLTAGGTGITGSNVIFGVTKVGGGIGALDVGEIKATGINLGMVVVTGNLEKIDVGDGISKKPAVRVLTVGSLGTPDGEIPDPENEEIYTSNITGNIGSLSVMGDVNYANINVTGTVNMLSIEGDFVGSGSLTNTQLQGLAALGRGAIAPVSGGTTLASSGLSATKLGTVNLKQSIVNAVVKSTSSISTVKIGANVTNSSIIAAGAVKSVQVGGNITSDTPGKPSVITALASVLNGSRLASVGMGTFTIKGDVLNTEILIGYDSNFVATNSDARVGKVMVTGSWKASSFSVGVADVTGDGFGRNDHPIFAGIDGTGLDPTPDIISTIGEIVIGKVAEGDDSDRHFGIVAQSIVKARINGKSITLSKTLKDNVLIGTKGNFRIVEVI